MSDVWRPISLAELNERDAALARARDRVAELEAQVAEVLADHVLDLTLKPVYYRCLNCDWEWPCPTARALGVES